MQRPGKAFMTVVVPEPNVHPSSKRRYPEEGLEIRLITHKRAAWCNNSAMNNIS
jgi:hypothetical protein